MLLTTSPRLVLGKRGIRFAGEQPRQVLAGAARLLRSRPRWRWASSSSATSFSSFLHLPAPYVISHAPLRRYETVAHMITDEGSGSGGGTPGRQATVLQGTVTHSSSLACRSASAAASCSGVPGAVRVPAPPAGPNLPPRRICLLNAFRPCTRAPLTPVEGRPMAPAPTSFSEADRLPLPPPPSGGSNSVSLAEKNSRSVSSERSRLQGQGQFGVVGVGPGGGYSESRCWHITEQRAHIAWRTNRGRAGVVRIFCYGCYSGWHGEGAPVGASAMQ